MLNTIFMFLLMVGGLSWTNKAVSEYKLPTFFPAPVLQQMEQRAGGDTTIYLTSGKAYGMPAAHLTTRRKVDYFSGHSFFKNPWVQAPATTKARDGLGPLFNTNSCKACHIGNGRGSVQQEGLVLLLARRENNNYVDDHRYGRQLQDRAIIGVEPEGRFNITWNQHSVVLADGYTVNLRTPQISVGNWSMGKPDSATGWSARIAPAIIGLGLLEAIPVQSIVDNADYQQNKTPAISGRVSWVDDLQTGEKVLGRFGWKAGQPTVKQQSAAAFSQDLGLTSSLYSQSSCTSWQVQCLRQQAGDGIDVSDSVMDMVTYYTRNIAVPAPRNSQSVEFRRGRQQFYRAGCAQCHRPHWRTTATADLSAQHIWPYTDLLLHDMGAGLAAPVGEGRVTGAEWKTPALWGIGLAKMVNPNTGYLHDGRARNLLEAILWHGGEGKASRQAVRLMSATEREDLLYFLRSL